MGVGPPSDFGLALYGEVIQQPVALKIIYNTCNCPASTFIGNQGPSAISVESISGGPINQALVY